MFGISHAQADAVRDGETDTTGLAWHVHVRDRLPMDILSQVNLNLSWYPIPVKLPLAGLPNFGLGLFHDALLYAGYPLDASRT